MVLGVLVAIVIAATVGVVMFAFGGSSSTEQTIQGAGCTLRNVPVMMHAGQPWRTHVEKLPKNFKYSTFPPTSGPHFGIPAPYGVYDQPVDQFRLVHNLEHGGVNIQYGRNVSRAEVNGLLEWYRKDPNGLVIAPLPALGSKIALTAWSADVNLQTGRVSNQQGHLATCDGFDETAYDTFATTYGFRGPEYHPRAVLTPGT
jgi:hypothetical protein